MLLRWAQSELAGLEPILIAAARAAGLSWQALAPALGVASRQAAERRYLRSTAVATDQPGDTRDARVQAERDRRAGHRAVVQWANHNTADLRRLPGQITALTDLDESDPRPPSPGCTRPSATRTRPPCPPCSRRSTTTCPSIPTWPTRSTPSPPTPTRSGAGRTARAVRRRPAAPPLDPRPDGRHADRSRPLGPAAAVSASSRSPNLGCGNDIETSRLCGPPGVSRDPTLTMSRVLDGAVVDGVFVLGEHGGDGVGGHGSGEVVALGSVVAQGEQALGFGDGFDAFGDGFDAEAVGELQDGGGDDAEVPWGMNDWSSLI